ncbi:hypothetical protein KBTX_02286 [wastewater metagenome]|uniref:2Fe-2S ferredoxin-type domain-containing protein n=2 Tax=unclassified sequences TaxID=12908 RepID=A0A5B8RGX9_9ZZZZ|nr:MULTISPECIES: 2Fe-2S iron-sulfur cluster-binding protein [Arhodomonas]MCS4503091.1 (2Fe-2S)-binding protein [Arhodomonas aquaeolei]QEA05957.1 hypothetical protein KBTEX_02286 [uncultured organism]
MSERGFRFIDTPETAIEVTVDGALRHLPAGRSLLAGLLATADGAPDFFCAIGQCQRCRVRVNGTSEVACLYTPRDGDTVETPETGGRA